jgi:hypothetical protein
LPLGLMEHTDCCAPAPAQPHAPPPHTQVLPPEVSAAARAKGWSRVQAKAAEMLRSNPNAYFYRHVAPGEAQVGACAGGAAGGLLVGLLAQRSAALQVRRRPTDPSPPLPPRRRRASGRLQSTSSSWPPQPRTAWATRGACLPREPPPGAALGWAGHPLQRPPPPAAGNPLLRSAAQLTAVPSARRAATSPSGWATSAPPTTGTPSSPAAWCWIPGARARRAGVGGGGRYAAALCCWPPLLLAPSTNAR